MRLTKKFCALFSSLAAVTASAQVVTQTPAPAPAGANPANDDTRLRDALRKALQGDAPAPTEPATPTTPAQPPTISTAPITAPSVTTRSYSYPGTNVVSNVVSTNRQTVSLSLEEAVLLALEHNRNIQVERYTPVISEYDRLSLYGYYDPVLATTWQKSRTETEGSGFNQNSGLPNPGSKTDVDSLDTTIGGYLPTGLRYDIREYVFNQDATTARISTLNTNGFDKINTDQWQAQGSIRLSQPLLRNFWIDNPRLQIKLQRQQVRITELELEQFVMDIINQVEQAYYTLVANRELVLAGEADVGVKKQFFDEQHRRVEVGSLAPLDETLAKAELALSELNLITARKNEADAEAILKGLINDNFVKHLNTRLNLTDRMLAIPAQLELFDAFREAVEKRPDLQAERLKLEQLKIQLKYDYNQMFPSLDVLGTYGVNGLDNHEDNALNDQSAQRFPQYSFGLRLTTPFTFWTERNKLKATKNAKSQEISRLKALEESIVQNVDAQVRLLRTIWETLPLRRAQTAYEESALEAEKKKLEAGKSTSYNVLSIASDLTKARTDEIGTLRDYNQAISELNFRKGTTLERWHINTPRNPSK